MAQMELKCRRCGRENDYAGATEERSYLGAPNYELARCPETGKHHDYVEQRD